MLTAKVQALLRRTYEFSREQAEIALGGGALRLREGVFVKGDLRLELTRNEFRILEMLLENRGRIVSREELMERLWSTDVLRRIRAARQLRPGGQDRGDRGHRP